MTISLLSNKEQKSSENKFFKIDATASSRAVNRRQWVRSCRTIVKRSSAAEPNDKRVAVMLAPPADIDFHTALKQRAGVMLLRADVDKRSKPGYV